MTPEEIERRDFFVGLRGYDRDEVDAFLAEVAGQHRALLDEVAALRRDEALAVDPIVDIGESVTAILRTANAQAEEIASQAREQAAAIQRQAEDDATQLRQEATVFAEHLRREADEEAGRIRSQAAQALDEAREQAARIVREAEEASERIAADAERRGRERALERADAEVARLGEAARQHEEVRARLAEASDELSLALLAMGEPVGDAFVAVRDAILTETTGTHEA